MTTYNVVSKSLQCRLRAKTLLIASETPGTYGIEVKAKYVSGVEIEGEIQSADQEIDH